MGTAREGDYTQRMRKPLYEFRVMHMDGWSDWEETTRNRMESLHRRRFPNWKGHWNRWVTVMRQGNIIETEVDNTLRQFRLIGSEEGGEVDHV